MVTIELTRDQARGLKWILFLWLETAKSEEDSELRILARQIKKQLYKKINPNLFKK